MRISAFIACLVMSGVLYLNAGAPQATCRVKLTLTDAADGRELPGLVRIVNADGRAVSSDALLSRGLGIAGELPIHEWLVLPRATEFDLPRGKYTISALSGLETELAQREIELKGAEMQISLPLTRFFSAARNGLQAGNTHLHLMKVSRETADRYLREVPRADALDLLFVSYLERADADREYITNRYTADDLARLARESQVAMGNGEEHRHNFTAQGEGYGHVMFLDLKQLVQPASIGPGIMLTGTDGLPLARGIDTARRDAAAIVWCHNEWGYEALPNWFSGRIDAQNIFDGSTRSSYKDSFYRYLNAGLRVPFSTGTDWFMYDFSRAYVRVDGKPAAANWLKGLAAGRSFITNGPLLTFTVQERLPGDTVELNSPGTVEIVGRGVGRVDFRQIELVRKGEVIATAQARRVGGHSEAEIKTKLNVTEPCWLALRTPSPSVEKDPDLREKTPPNELGLELFSHTSPVYVTLAGRSVFLRDVAQALLEKMKNNRAQVVRLGQFDDDLAKARVLDVYDDGIAALEKRLAEGR
ncbi:MAG: CehA/McbA family metallohydrolase [Planctomycetia bacterium]|nr:CehA/McbA family metallohydrolase [Planctomycetia bacterium]